MSTFETPTQNRTGPRPRYVPIGTDTQGDHHCYRTVDETILVVSDERVTERFELANKSVDTYVRFVRDDVGGREWAERRYLLPGEMTERVAKAVREAV
jgi:hypothetical protein